MREKIDIYFISRNAKVSPATVSRVFNRTELVSKKTIKRVLDVCKKYDYRPSVVASSMRTKRTKYIGIVLPNMVNPFFFELLKGAEQYAGQKDYYIVLFNSENNYDKEIIFLDAIFKRRIDGIIISGIAGGRKDNFFVKEILKKGLPCVLVDRYVEGLGVPCVIADNLKGGEIAADYLLKNKNKKIGIITYELKVKILKDRYLGFKNILEKNNMSEGFLIQLPIDTVNILADLENHKKTILDNKPDAVFCISDLIAINFIEFLKKNKVRIPEDISVLGFDNIPFTEMLEPKLTTVSQDIYRMGEMSAKLLINIINDYGKNNKSRYKNKVLLPELIVRDSCIKR
ncbi:MAG: LacI family transcriptional regulator [Actinobacteria bacterium]|nr:LacI family transcriptional regulator [Actinomycetota bacterium]